MNNDEKINIEDNKTKTKKISIGTMIMVVIFVLCICFMIAGTKAIKEHKMLSIFGYSYSVVPTDSMVPTINIDDVILVKNVPYNELKVDDIIVYYSEKNNINIVHRIIGTFDDGTFETKGDHNTSSDGVHITEDIYLGKVVSHGKALGIGKLVNNGRDIVFILIIIIFLYLMISEIINIIKIVKEKDDLKQKEIIESKNQEILNKQKEELRKEVMKELESKKNENGQN